MNACPVCGQTIERPAPAVPGWTFVLPVKLKSLNAHVGNFGSSRWAYKKARDEWCRWFVVERANRNIPKATGKRHVTLTRLFSGRERLWDFDNLVGAGKPVLDAMVSAGLLVDDSVVFVTCDYDQSRDEASGVRVTVRDV